jgi:hypothetical protein
MKEPLRRMMKRKVKMEMQVNRKMKRMRTMTSDLSFWRLDAKGGEVFA